MARRESVLVEILCDQCDKPVDLFPKDRLSYNQSILNSRGIPGLAPTADIDFCSVECRDEWFQAALETLKRDTTARLVYGYHE